MGATSTGLGVSAEARLSARALDSKSRCPAAVHSPPFRAVVRSYRAIFCVARRGKAFRGKFVFRDEKFYELRGARGRKFPIGIESRIVNRNIIRVSFDSLSFAAHAKNSCKRVNRRLRRSAKVCGAALVKTDFAQADNDAFAAGPDVHNAVANLRRERSFQINLHAFEGNVLLLRRTLVSKRHGTKILVLRWQFGKKLASRFPSFSSAC